MLDWIEIGSNVLWIFALALLLSVLSFAYWGKNISGERMSVILAGSRWRIALNVAGIMFCSGLGAVSDTIWEQVLWLVLAVFFLFRVWILVRS